MLKKKLTAILAVLIISVFISNLYQSDASAKYNSVLEYERAFDFEEGSGTLQKIFNGIIKTVSIVKVCIFDKVMFNISPLNNTCIPDIIGKDIADDGCNNSKSYASVGKQIMSYAFLAALFFLFIAAMIATFAYGFFLFVLLAATIILSILDACIGSYVIAPHEIMNMYNAAYKDKDSWRCKTNPATFQLDNMGADALGPADVPFLYTCKEPEGKGKYIYGSMFGTSFCNGKNKENSVDHKGLEVGSIYFGGIDFWKRIVNRGRKNICPSYFKPKDNLDAVGMMTKAQIKQGVNSRIMSSYLGFGYSTAAFYRYKSGKVELCAVFETVVPIIAGCTPVPPPYEKGSEYSANTSIGATRCNYFIHSGRPDLNSLGRMLYEKDSKNSEATNSLQPIYFLMGDIHIGSTVIGCIEDLVELVLIGDGKKDSNYKDGMLQNAQRRIKQAVFATLIFYITLLGIKIMSAAQLPKRNEWIMYGIKFVFVIAFSTGDVWQNNNKSFGQGDGPGLYTGMRYISRAVANIFMQASDVNDPIKSCRYMLGRDNRNIIGEYIYRVGESNMVPTSFVGPNNNQGSVYLTVWDQLDCKIASYLNFGTCRYDLSSIIIIWLVPSAFFAGLKGMLVSLILIVYMILVVGMILRFMHVCIIAIFMTAVLVLMAPIFCCFILFDYTKEIFNNWVKHLIGYTLYPGMLFAFVALMIATFDSIFYGIDSNKIDAATNSGVFNMGAMCTDVDSVYCGLYKTLEQNMRIKGASPEKMSKRDLACEYTVGNIYEAMIQTEVFLYFFRIDIMRPDLIDKFYWPLINIMLFAILFYVFSNSVIEFMEAMFGVAGIGSSAVDFVGMMKDGVKKGAEAYASGGAKVAKGAFNAITGRGGGDDDKKKRD